MIKDLFNECGGLDLENIEYLADLKDKKGDEWKSFLAFCDSTFNNRYFEPFIKAIKFGQMQYTYKNADNYEMFNFGRTVSITLDILYEEFKRYSNKYLELTKGGSK